MLFPHGKFIGLTTTLILYEVNCNKNCSYIYNSPDEFGQTTVDGDYTFANEICYTGGIYDWSTGQYYLNARYYDLSTGRFLSEDTYRGDVNDPDTLHLYAYCANNPVNYVDPSGHASQYTKFNCYAFAVGINYRWMIPGHADWSDSLPNYYSVTQLRNWVKQDFGSRVRNLSSKTGILKAGEYRIAMRTVKILYGPRYFTLDFHFWKQNPTTKKWYNKHGRLIIQPLGDANPDNQGSRGWHYDDYAIPNSSYSWTNLHYNSATLYVAFKGRFWAL